MVVGVCASVTGAAESVAVCVSVTGVDVVSEDICMVPGLVDIVQLPDPGHRFTGSPVCLSPNSVYQLDSSEGS